ncbi:MAG: spermidine synthase [Deltaproteobacteria bacterium]|nr:spermidine synthase [Deltaproteobacteria bacterium]
MVTFSLCWIFFLSGVAALMFENLWFYQAGIALGNSVWASSLVLAGFMGGLALGNAAAGRFGHRVGRPIRAYAFLELTIGLAGFSLVLVLPALTPALASVLGPFLDLPWVMNPLRLSVAFALLVAPAAAMGATLPVLVAALYRRDPRFGRVLGLLYGWNTLGAVVGALVGELWLLEALGVRGTAAAAVAVNIVAALGAAALSRRLEPTTEAQPRPTPVAMAPRARLYLLAAAIFGFALLGLEVVWFRFLMLFVWGTGAAFAILLAVVLAGIGLGGLLGSRLASRAQGGLLPSLAFLCGAVCLLLYAGFQSGPRAYLWVDVARLAALLMFPVALLSGVIFTLLGDAIEEAAPGESRAAGFLTFANTAGATLGSLFAGFVLLPRLGMEGSWALLGVLYGVAAAVLWLAGARPTGRAARIGAFTSAALWFVACVVLPYGQMERRHLPAAIAFYTGAARTAVADVREGLTETIVYLETRAFGEPHSHRMLTNGFSMSGTNLNAQRYMKLFVHLPAALHPELRSALLISFGVGMTAEALVKTDSLERIDVVDISRDVLEMNRVVFPDPKTAPLSDPRVQVHVGDGRYFLQTTRQRFDLITGEPPPPKLAGVTRLYTREYFELVHGRLNEGGLVSYWLPVHSLMGDDAPSMIRAFCDVFRDCTLFGGAGLDWILLGSRGGVGAVPLSRLARPWRPGAVADELRSIGVESPAQLGALFIADAEQLQELIGDAPPVTDDHPKRLSETVPDVSQAAPRFRAWMHGSATTRRFEESDWVERVWPPSLRAQTRAAMAAEAGYQEVTLFGRRPFVKSLPSLDRALRTTRQVTLPLWLLGSDADRQAAAGRRLAEPGRHSAARAEVALGALASRRYGEAADAFSTARAELANAPGTEAWRQAEVYSRLMAGDSTGAQAPLAELRASAAPADRELLEFLEAHFEL